MHFICFFDFLHFKGATVFSAAEDFLFRFKDKFEFKNVLNIILHPLLSHTIVYSKYYTINKI